MTEFLSFNLNEAYAEIKVIAEAEGVTSQESFNSVVENYLNDKLSAGELNVDDDTEDMESQLKAMWPEYEKNLNIK